MTDTDESPSMRRSREAHERMIARDDLTMFGSETIVMILYPGFTALDLVGPQYFCGSLMGATVHLAAPAPAGTLFRSDTGVTVVSTADLADVERCDVLIVPGSGGGVVGAMSDPALLDHVRRLSRDARIVASVCTGAFVLGAAGLLEGRRATSHWVMRDVLAQYGAEPVHERLVIDGDLWTAAGVTAGIDLGVALSAHLRGPGYGRALELQAELVTPNPPDTFGIEDDMAEMFAPTTEQLRAIAPRPPIDG